MVPETPQRNLKEMRNVASNLPNNISNILLYFDEGLQQIPLLGDLTGPALNTFGQN